MDIWISEKKVVLRERYPSSEFGALKKQIQGHDSGAQWDADAKLFRNFVESWEFDGDPQDITSWGKLDVFEMMAIDRAIATEIIEKRVEYSKNATSGPIEELQDESL